MSWLSFRAKLLLAMMVVVVGVTGTTLYVSQQRMHATYQALFEKQFDGQIRFFADLQRARLAFIAERCDALVGSVRIQAALEEGDADLLYESAADELRDLREMAARRYAATFFRFLDAQGRPIPTDNERAGLIQPERREALREKLKVVQTIMAGPARQEIGFIATPTEEDPAQLHEVILTKVVDTVENRTLGALLLAFPVPEVSDRRALSPNSAAERFSLSGISRGDIRLGLWLDGELYARQQSIPPPVREDLKRMLNRALSGQADRESSLTVDVEGTPHRLFYRGLITESSFAPTYQICLYSLRTVLEEQRDLELRVLAFGFLGLLGGLGISLALSHGLSVPVRELARGTSRIRQGDYQVRVPVRGHDDLGNLAASFNEMADGLAQKERFRTLLNQVADEQIARRLIQDGGALGGERRQASVLFCDIRGFTALTEKMAPEEVIDFLNEHMTAMAHLVKLYGGVVDKFVGDLIMALFGAPFTSGQDVNSAARCALAMVEEREKLNRTTRNAFSVGIGLATGEMVAGCMGSTDRLNYTVLGPRVNLASRLCGQAQANWVVIDANTRDALGETARVEPLAPAVLKGFSGPVPAFRLLGMETKPKE